jgi:hypothetical protein
MGHRRHPVDQYYGVLRRRPAAFYMFDELCSLQQGSDHRVKFIPVQELYTLDIETIMIKGNIIRWLVHGCPPLNIYAMHAQGKSGCQCPICTVSDGSMVDP